MADTTRSDAVLAQRVRAGDREALGELYDRHAPMALGVAMRVVGDRQLAEDVVHDAFVVIWQKIGRYDSRRGELRAWLLTIVRNRAIDRMRRTRRSMDIDDVEEARLGSGPNPTWEDAIQRLSGAELRAAMAHLPEEQRTALDLAYFGGHTYREVAEITGVAPGTASGRMRLALAHLRRLLAGTDAAPLRELSPTAPEPDR